MKMILLITVLLFVSVGNSQQIIHTRIYDNGNIKNISYFKKKRTEIDKIKEESYFENGKKESEESYKDGKLNGLSINWYENGNKKSEESYKDGKSVSFSSWNKDGVKIVEGLDIQSSSFKVRTGAMEGTLFVGDNIKISKIFDNINLLGKIIVFKYPRDSLKYSISRIVANPGDTIKVSNKKLYVNMKEIPLWENGKFLQPSMQKKFKQPDIFLSSETNINKDNLGPIYIPKKGDTFPIYEETNWRYLLPIIIMEGHTVSLNNKQISYEFTLQDPNEIYRRKGKESVYKEYFPNGGNLITPWSNALKSEHFQYLMIDGRPANEFKEYVVTQNYYWAMGDNRDDSLDSRYWGFVPKSLILGYMIGLKN